MWNFEDLDKNLKELSNGIPKILDGMAVVCANEVRASHRKRLDRGEPRKKYKSNAYKKLRSGKGRQTDYIDMQLSGELVRSMQIGTDSGDVVYGIVNRKTGNSDTSSVYNYQKEKHPGLINVNSQDGQKGIEKANTYFTDKIEELFDSIQ